MRGVSLRKLPADELLDVAYWALIERLKHDPDRNHREDLDTKLGTSDWYTPGARTWQASRPVGAPSWWYGDEEASASMLRGLGVRRLT
jgi:hypothetical protein